MSIQNYKAPMNDIKITKIFKKFLVFIADKIYNIEVGL